MSTLENRLAELGVEDVFQNALAPSLLFLKGGWILYVRSGEDKTIALVDPKTKHRISDDAGKFPT